MDGTEGTVKKSCIQGGEIWSLYNRYSLPNMPTKSVNPLFHVT